MESDDSRLIGHDNTLIACLHARIAAPRRLNVSLSA